MRVMAASRVAKSAKQWVDHFSYLKSGTYSSQWMIVDYNVFSNIIGTTNRKSNLLYMMEEEPHRIVSHDISEYFYEHSYFGSFNRAFLENTNKDLRTNLIVNLYGDNFKYENANRGKIFKNIHNNVVDLKTMKDALRYNGFKNPAFNDDPSYGAPEHGISSRSDLSSLYNLSGGIDCKVTNFEMVKKQECIAISGPTNERGLSAFEFSAVQTNDSHKGVPDKFNFPFVLMSPKTLCCDNNDIYQFK
jgi:hypothetical protein